jgi:hypothetical protein
LATDENGCRKDKSAFTHLPPRPPDRTGIYRCARSCRSLGPGTRWKVGWLGRHMIYRPDGEPVCYCRYPPRIGPSNCRRERNRSLSRRRPGLAAASDALITSKPAFCSQVNLRRLHPKTWGFRSGFPDEEGGFGDAAPVFQQQSRAIGVSSFIRRRRGASDHP